MMTIVPIRFTALSQTLSIQYTLSPLKNQYQYGSLLGSPFGAIPARLLVKLETKVIDETDDYYQRDQMFKPNHAADILYPLLRNRARRGQIWSTLARRSRQLLSLTEIAAQDAVKSRHFAGVQTVPIDQIRGSESGNKNFDRNFNPLQDRTKQRWVNIAAAWKWGKNLPIVELIQIGDVYFVRDGHHRISVARALGLKEIEAEVTVWQLAGPLPVERPATSNPLTIIKHFSKQVWGASRNLHPLRA